MRTYTALLLALAVVSTAAASFGAEVTFRKQYVDGDFGQVHVLLSQPVLILNTHGSLENQTRALAAFFRHAELIEIPTLHHGVFDVGASQLSEHVRDRMD